MTKDEKSRVSHAILDLLDILAMAKVPDELMRVWEARNAQLIGEVTNTSTQQTSQTSRAIGFVNTRAPEVN